MADQLTDDKLREYLSLEAKLAPGDWAASGHLYSSACLVMGAAGTYGTVQEHAGVPDPPAGDDLVDQALLDASEFAAVSRTIGPAAAREVLRLREVLHDILTTTEECTCDNNSCVVCIAKEALSD